QTPVVSEQVFYGLQQQPPSSPMMKPLPPSPSSSVSSFTNTPTNSTSRNHRQDSIPFSLYSPQALQQVHNQVSISFPLGSSRMPPPPPAQHAFPEHQYRYLYQQQSQTPMSGLPSPPISPPNSTAQHPMTAHPSSRRPSYASHYSVAPPSSSYPPPQLQHPAMRTTPPDSLYSVSTAHQHPNSTTFSNQNPNTYQSPNQFNHQAAAAAAPASSLQHRIQLEMRNAKADPAVNSADRAVFRIVEMGFTSQEAKRALRETDLGDGLRVDRAVELLLRS
ncbi:hypothetical protein LTS18_000168, partial [Coniosporium uncinatum]